MYHYYHHRAWRTLRHFAPTCNRYATTWQHALAALCDANTPSSSKISTNSAALLRLHQDALRVCAQARKWSSISPIIESMWKSNLTPSTIDYNMALNALRKQRLWRDALALLLTISPQKRNVVSYNTVLSACAADGLWQQCVEVFAQMQEHAVAPDSVSCNAVMSAMAKSGEWESCMRLLDRMQNEYRCVPNVVSFSTCMTALANGGKYAEALELLRSMDAIYYVAPNVVTYSAAITACAKASKGLDQGLWVQALALLEEMARRDVPANAIAYNAAMSACEKGNQWRHAISLLRAMECASIPPTTVSYNACISACEKGASWQSALSLLSELRAHKTLVPTVVSFNAAISACEKGNQWENALRLLNYMRGISAGDEVATSSTARVAPDGVSYAAAISACEKGNQWQSALRLLDNMESDKLAPDVIAYSAAIRACANADDANTEVWHIALTLLRAMKDAALQPNAISYNAAITACDKGGGANWSSALALFEDMHTCDVAPTVVSYNAMISVFGKGAQWQRALTLFQHAYTSNTIDAITYNVITDTLARAGQHLVAMRIYRFGLQQNMFRPLWKGPPTDLCADFHDLSMPQATIALMVILDLLRTDTDLHACIRTHTRLCIICGRGSHSAGNNSVLKPHVLHVLNTEFSPPLRAEVAHGFSGGRIHVPTKDIIAWIAAREAEE